MNKPRKNALEWLVFGASAILVLATIGVLVAEGMRSDGDAPSLGIEIGSATRDRGAHRVPVTVRNTGDVTAEQVRIEVLLLDGEREAERGELTFVFVPRNSSRQGWVTFHRDPSCCRVIARPAGFNTP